MNETLKFHGVTEMTFPSTVGRSACAQRLASPLRGTQGYFLMQEDMNDFVTSQPTIVFGELCYFSVATFRRKIGRYAEGDDGLIRATMRASCGLLAEDVALHPAGANHGSPLGQARAWWRPWRRGRYLGDEQGLVRCHVSLVQHCLERGWDFRSEHHAPGHVAEGEPCGN